MILEAKVVKFNPDVQNDGKNISSERKSFEMIVHIFGPKTCGCQFKSSNASFRLVFVAIESFNTCRPFCNFEI